MADRYEVERSTTIHKTPEVVYDLLRDLSTYDEWSPWSELDPDLEVSHTGQNGEVGAAYSWSGNRKAGKGNMTISELDAPSRIALDLVFEKPFKATNAVEWLIDAEGDDSSRMTWRMTGANTFMVKVMGLFGRTMDKMVGPDFEQGLANLKSELEAS